MLRKEVFRYFPERPAPLEAQWGEKTVARGRMIKKVTFTSFDGLRVKGLFSLPANLGPGVKLPAVLLADHRKGIPVWGNEQPLEQNQWGGRAVLIVETIDQGSRAPERNLRSFSDNDPLHHMKRQAMVAGTTLESMQMHELQRSLELLRSLPKRCESRHDDRKGRDGRQLHVRGFAGRKGPACHRQFADGLPPAGASLSRDTALHRHPGGCGSINRQAEHLWRCNAGSEIAASLQFARRLPAPVAAAISYGATQRKFSAWSMLPEPLYFAVCG